MAEKSGFFNSVNGDRKYKADFFAEYFASFIGNGVFPNPSNALQVIASTNMNIIVKAGKAWINGYYYNNDTDLTLTLDTADGVLNRIDKIVLQFNTLSRTISVKVKKGTFASAAVAPALQRDANSYELALADVYITKGSINVLQSNITDIRLDSGRCGIVHGTVDQVDTTTLFNQYQSWLNDKKTTYDTDFTNWTTQKKTDYESWYNTTIQREQSEIDAMEAQFQNDFDTWFASVKNVLDDNTIGNLNNKIDAIPKVFKGTDAPTAPAAIDIWFKDLGNGNVQINERNSDNTAWVEVFTKTKAGNVMTNAGLDMEAQLADLQKVQTAGGTATAITLTNVSLTDGFTKTFIVGANNSAAATTVNGKPLYKPNTTTPPNLTKCKAVTIWYDLAKAAFFFKASTEGNTIAAHVLAGDSFSNDDDTGIVGTMPNNGALNKSLAINGTYTIPAGYTSGGSVTQSIPTKAAATITPTTSDQSIGANQYLTGTQTIKGDANLQSKYIVQGVSVFGIAGSATVESLGGSFTEFYRTSTTYSYATPCLAVDNDGCVYLLYCSSGYTTVDLMKFDQKLNLITKVSWTKPTTIDMPFLRFDKWTNLLWVNIAQGGGTNSGWYDTNLNSVGWTYRTNRCLAHSQTSYTYALDDSNGDIYKVTKSGTSAIIQRFDLNGNQVYSSTIASVFNSSSSSITGLGISTNYLYIVDSYGNSTYTYYVRANKSDGLSNAKNGLSSIYQIAFIGNGTTDYVYKPFRASTSSSSSYGSYILKESGTTISVSNGGYGYTAGFSPAGRSVIVLGDSTGGTGASGTGVTVSDGNITSVTASYPFGGLFTESNNFIGAAGNANNEFAILGNGKNVIKFKV
ncbi:hypothetical protein B0H39_004664 [Clostridium beijerinckii]|uniref:hypothetical protein n=1 Tax=Clostridium beijerinckii TaxID=1520 RepID=UPI001494E2A7|nr:hypothetical protein [Clostridium beijerinckii]NOW86783.1 hypothetical protein [Clostridium beijerinckii]